MQETILKIGRQYPSHPVLYKRAVKPVFKNTNKDELP